MDITHKDKKKKSFGFVLKKNEYTTVIFRFYPEESHVHGFDDCCPKTWDEVYKTYYSWSILINDFNEKWRFDVGFDECSVLGEIPDIIDRFIAEDKDDRAQLYSFGDGADWYIDFASFGFVKERRFEFNIWYNGNRGYRFLMDKDTAKRFAEFIRKIQAYMIRHSEPI